MILPSLSVANAALAALAMGAPLLAGVAAVGWSKARAAARMRREAEVAGRLTGFYRTIEAEPTPERLALVADALDEAAVMAAQAPARTRARKTVPGTEDA